MKMRRGDLLIVALPGDFGKPRPALVVQSDAFNEIASLTVLPLTSDLQPAPLVRIAVEPTGSNGLQTRSQIMVDKATTVSRTKIGRHIGRADDRTMRLVDHALAQFLELG
jgi:mRNA interferase MazF